MKRLLFGFSIPLLTVLLAGCGLFGGSSHPFKDRQLEQSLQLDRNKKMNDQAFAEALKGGADPNLELKNGGTPLIMAVVYDRTDLIRTLLQSGAKVNHPGKRGSTPLHVAAGLGRKECLDLLLKAGAEVNAPGAFGRTPLMDASRMGQLEIMDELIEAGAKIDALDELKRTALMHAAEAHKNTVAAVRLLASRGADPMLFDSDMKTAAMHAAELKHTEAALYLIDLIPDLPRRPALGLLIMHSAIKGNDLKVMERLIDQRVPLNRSLSMVLKGSRILQVHGFYRILIRNGLLGRGRVPLHWAAIENNLDAIKLLLAHGADPFQQDELGLEADELATSRAVVQYIRKQKKSLDDNGGK
ncbi:MAG: ankyrin repeat domain-containing protein [Lentisphaeria bacterium]|nr:ankyrin repeat domain-containing protein [Lentisphaeria bacterium]